MGKKNFKPIYLDHAIWSSVDDTEPRYYALTDRQVMALQAFTEFLVWRTRWENAETWDLNQITEWRAALELALQEEKDCTMFDCSILEDCLPDSPEIIGIKRTVASQQITLDDYNAVNALTDYASAGSDIHVYNPSVPTDFSSDAATEEILCVVALTFVEELARKLNNYSALALNAGNIVMTFAGLIPGLAESIPSWLSAINNYLLQPIGLSLPDYTEMQSVVNDEDAVYLMACKLADVLTGQPVSYAGYLDYLAAIPMIIGNDSANVMRTYIQGYCANEQAYLYFCDLLGLAHDDPYSYTFDCVCGLAPLAFVGWDYRTGQHGSYIAQSSAGAYVTGQGYSYYNGTFWDRSHIAQPTGGISARYLHVFQYRVGQQGYAGDPAITVRAFNASDTQIGAASKVLWNGLTGTYDGMDYLTLDLGSVVNDIARINVFNLAGNNAAVSNYRVYALGYST